MKLQQFKIDCSFYLCICNSPSFFLTFELFFYSVDQSEAVYTKQTNKCRSGFINKIK